MSQGNVELHYRVLDAINRHDLDFLLTLMDDDVEAVPRIAAVEGDFHGHDGMRRWWEITLDSFPDLSIETVEVHDFGDLTVAALRAFGHGAGSEVPLEDSLWQANRWRQGKCVWWRIFEARAEALEAVGLSEQDAHADS